MDTKQRLLGYALLASAVIAASPVDAGQNGMAHRAPPHRAAGASQPPASMPDIEQVYVLIRSAILRLDSAVHAGNFSVLRDGGAPSFQAANTSARLARIFQNLDEQRIDLSSIAITAPKISRLESLDRGRRLRVRGYYQSPTTRIDFDLIFEQVGVHWRIFGISVNPAPVLAHNTPHLKRMQPAPATPTRLSQFSPSWDLVSNTRR
jgi:hypothetical protein